MMTYIYGINCLVVEKPHIIWRKNKGLEKPWYKTYIAFNQSYMIHILILSIQKISYLLKS